MFQFNLFSCLYEITKYRIRPFEPTVRLANWNGGALIKKHFSELSENLNFKKLSTNNKVIVIYMFQVKIYYF